MAYDAHFSAYSFVDRIDAFESGRHAKGVFAIPASLAAFPAALVAEAVGQLAAWTAMDRIEFRGRPVAALATETRFYADAKPGDVLTLATDLFACDDEAVAYNGRASVGGKTVVELVDCLGPMLPVEEFDSPAALAARFDLIRGAGATPGRFHGVPFPQVVRTAGVPGVSASATLHVPESAPFFGDHFPRRPVFPATLLLDAQIRLALEVAAEATHWPAGTRPAPYRMTHVKMRSFIPPGALVDIDAEMAPPEAGSAMVRLTARMNGKVAATARLELSARKGQP